MSPQQIKTYLNNHCSKKNRTMVIVDFGNVEKWKENLGWSVGVRQLALLIRNFSSGAIYLRRFYYGSDFGKSDKSNTLEPWSKAMIETAKFNKLQVVTKRVKYIHTKDSQMDKKCDLDVEMAVDLIRESDNYDCAVIFSGDGDLAYAMRYLHDTLGKEFIVFGARNHIGREIIDAHRDGVISKILYAEDFESRLDKDRR